MSTVGKTAFHALSSFSVFGVEIASRIYSEAGLYSLRDFNKVEFGCTNNVNRLLYPNSSSSDEGVASIIFFFKIQFNLSLFFTLKKKKTYFRYRILLQALCLNYRGDSTKLRFDPYFIVVIMKGKR